ncbi:Conserved oligomeric Golgi complex, subunit 4, partial [Cynara cardunculus var. scolymus]
LIRLRATCFISNICNLCSLLSIFFAFLLAGLRSDGDVPSSSSLNIDRRSSSSFLLDLFLSLLLLESRACFTILVKGWSLWPPYSGKVARRRSTISSKDGVALPKGFFMVENVRKAIKIDEHVMDSLTTSMVDDSCCRRSISTSNINSVIVALSSAVSLLGGEYNDALQQKMREPNLGGKLFLGGVGVQKAGIDIATALNNMDVSIEYALKLRHEIEEQCAEISMFTCD